MRREENTRTQEQAQGHKDEHSPPVHVMKVT
jgi:hypothetical protein